MASPQGGPRVRRTRAVYSEQLYRSFNRQ
jgi:hypothetical protein